MHELLVGIVLQNLVNFTFRPNNCWFFILNKLFVFQLYILYLFRWQILFLRLLGLVTVLTLLHFLHRRLLPVLLLWRRFFLLFTFVDGLLVQSSKVHLILLVGGEFPSVGPDMHNFLYAFIQFKIM